MLNSLPTSRFYGFGLLTFFLVLTIGQSKCGKSPFTDCHPDRATKQEVNDQSGTMKLVNADNWVIVYAEDGSRRYLPCALEDQWKEEGKQVIFSGLEKEIKPNERWVGTPFVIQSIKSN